MGLGEGICNHFSAEVPGRTGHFLINPQGLHWSEVQFLSPRPKNQRVPSGALFCFGNLS